MIGCGITEVIELGGIIFRICLGDEIGTKVGD